MPRRKLSGLLVAAALTGSGCATLAHGRTQEISIRSVPAGARIYIGSELVGETPARVLVRRRERDAVVRIEKEGFEPAEVTLTRKASGWILGDVGWAAAQFQNQGLRSTSQAPTAAISVAAISIGVDVATGSAWRQSPGEVRVMLKPVEMSVR